LSSQPPHSPASFLLFVLLCKEWMAMHPLYKRVMPWSPIQTINMAINEATIVERWGRRDYNLVAGVVKESVKKKWKGTVVAASLNPKFSHIVFFCPERKLNFGFFFSYVMLLIFFIINFIFLFLFILIKWLIIFLFLHLKSWYNIFKI
jgi:hypothetical protein